jgi:hypothetical protein
MTPAAWFLSAWVASAPLGLAIAGMICAATRTKVNPKPTVEPAHRPGVSPSELAAWDVVFCRDCSRVIDSWRPPRHDGTDQCDRCWFSTPGPKRKAVKA